MRGRRVRQEEGDGAEHHHEDEEAEAKNRPVEGEPAAGEHRPHRAERRQRRQCDRDAGRQDRSNRDGRHQTDQPVENGVGRVRAQGPEDPQILAVGAQPARNDLGRNEDGSKKRDRPEDPQRNGYRLQRIVRLGDDRCQGVIGDLEAGRGEADELALHERHGGSPSSRLDAEGQRAGQSPLRQRLPGEGRGQRDERGQRVDVVLDDLRAQRGQTDELHVDPQCRWHRLGPELRQVLLVIRIEPERDHLPDVEPEKLGHDGRHDDLVGTLRGRQPSLVQHHAVLGEEEPVDAGHRIRQSRHPDSRGAVASEGSAGGDEAGGDVPDPGQPGNLTGERRPVVDGAVPRIDRYLEVRRVRRGQEDRERRLGAPRRGQAAQAQATDQAEEDNEGEVAGPAMPERGSRAVPNQAEALPSHGADSPPSSCVTST